MNLTENMLFIVPIETETVSEHGLLVVENDLWKATKSGVVYLAGRNEQYQLKEGDTVHFYKQGAISFVVDGKKGFLIKIDNVFAYEKDWSNRDG